MINNNNRVQKSNLRNSAPLKIEPLPVEQFLIQNCYPYITEGNLFFVQKNIRIYDRDSDIDFSNVYASKVIYYNNKCVDLSKMPYTEPGGLMVKNYKKVRSLGKNIYAEAYKHGFSKKSSRLVEQANPRGLKKIALVFLGGLFASDYS